MLTSGVSGDPGANESLIWGNGKAATFPSHASRLDIAKWATSTPPAHVFTESGETRRLNYTTFGGCPPSDNWVSEASDDVRTDLRLVLPGSYRFLRLADVKIVSCPDLLYEVRRKLLGAYRASPQYGVKRTSCSRSTTPTHHAGQEVELAPMAPGERHRWIRWKDRRDIHLES